MQKKVLALVFAALACFAGTAFASTQAPPSTVVMASSIDVKTDATAARQYLPDKSVVAVVHALETTTTTGLATVYSPHKAKQLLIATSTPSALGGDHANGALASFYTKPSFASAPLAGGHTYASACWQTTSGGGFGWSRT